MNILVTGAAGFLGMAMVKRLYDEGVPNRTVIGLLHDRDPHLCHYWSNQPWRQGSVMDYPRMLELIVNDEIDQIYHCAAKPIVRNCNADPVGCFNVNVVGTATVLEAARQSGRVSGILCMESDKAFGTAPLPYSESQALQPSGIYEASKACVSHLVRAYHHTYGTPVFGIKSANFYGPGDQQFSRLIPNTITRLLRGEKTQITTGAALFSREFIYVDDLVRFAVALMDKRPWGRSINVGTGDTATVADVIKLICKLMDKPFEVEDWPKPDTLKEIPCQVLDISGLCALVPEVRTSMSLREGLEKTIDWYRNN